MKIDYKYFKKAKKLYGSSDIQIGIWKESISIRFGYWRQVDLEKLKNIFPDHLEVTEQLVDDDSDCGPLYEYYINYEMFKNK
jgi:hypothetical protein